MTRRSLAVTVAVIAVLVLAVVWIGRRTYWADIEVPLPPRGEAATNPTYSAQHFVARLGMTVTRERFLNVPVSNEVIVLSSWNWGLNPDRRRRLERWVESGGRLVVDATVSLDAEFSRWAGVSSRLRRVERPGERTESSNKVPVPCRQFRDPAGKTHWLCDMFDSESLFPSREPEWLLREQTLGTQAVRMRVGRGSVSLVNGDPFRYRALFDGDHGWLLVTAGQLRAGDVVHFLSEGEYPSLLALTWQYGGPVVLLVLLLVLLTLWRGAVRFGPLEPEPSGARRSLAEQIRGTGSFVYRHGDGHALHAATARALDDAARRRIPGYTTLLPQERTVALATLTGLGAGALAEALFHPESHSHDSLPATITLLETARRRLLVQAAQTKVAHGTA